MNENEIPSNVENNNYYTVSAEKCALHGFSFIDIICQDYIKQVLNLKMT